MHLILKDESIPDILVIENMLCCKYFAPFNEVQVFELFRIVKCLGANIYSNHMHHFTTLSKVPVCMLGA